ncbi:MAG: hypothetical protein B7Z55_16955, partial [Planctomycetales bacterium 12-60-4]
SGSRVEHWMNGQKVAEYDRADDAWKQQVASAPAFRTAAQNFHRAGLGHLALQSYDGNVWYRNLRVRPLGAAMATTTLTSASGRVSLTGPELFDLFTNDDKWEWTSAENLGPVINTTHGEYSPAISGDGLTLIYFSSRPETSGKWDLWSSRRISRDATFATPENLGPQLNSTEHDYSPWLSADGRTLLFATRRDGMKQSDLWQTTRPDVRASFATPSAVPGAVNTTSAETSGTLTADGLRIIFASTNGGNEDLYESSRTSRDAAFVSPKRLGGDINGPNFERNPWLSADGLLLVYNEEPQSESNPSTQAKFWVTLRPSVNEPFGPRVPVTIQPPKDTPLGPRRFTSTADGQQVFFAAESSVGVGGYDLWTVRRVPRAA